MLAFNGIHQELERVMQQLHQHSYLSENRDPHLEAAALHALVDGLTLHMLIGKLGAELTALNQHLERLLP